jgi:Ca2+-binding EF-hand superfamily protein
LTRDFAVSYIDDPSEAVPKNSLRKGRRTMKPSVIILIAAAALLLICVSPSLADTASKAAKAAVEKRFEEMDTNGDGKIDWAEYVEYEIKKAKERFDVADENRDGFITRKEAERATMENQKEMRKKMEKWRQKQEQGMMKGQP